MLENEITFLSEWEVNPLLYDLDTKEKNGEDRAESGRPSTVQSES